MSMSKLWTLLNILLCKNYETFCWEQYNTRITQYAKLYLLSNFSLNIITDTYCQIFPGLQSGLHANPMSQMSQSMSANYMSSNNVGSGIPSMNSIMQQQSQNPLQVQQQQMQLQQQSAQMTPPQQQMQQQQQVQQQTVATTSATPPAPQPVPSKEINTVSLCRIGQETVQDIVSRTQEVFQNLKAIHVGFICVIV